MPSIDKKSGNFFSFLPFVAGTSDLEPLTPPDTDIRAVPWFKLDMLKLGHSEFLHVANNEELGAAFKLWMFAIHQVPAGSLPNNEVVLAQAAGYDHRKKAWQRVRGMALYGWALCSDGRLYHQTVAMTVLDILQSLQSRQSGQSGQSGGDDAMERLREQNRRRQQRFKEKQRESQMRRAGDSEAPEVREGTPASAAPVTAAVTLADSAGITLPITLSNKELDKDKDQEKHYDNNAQVTLQASLPVTLPNGGLPAAPEGFQVGQQDTISTREGLVCKRLRELGVRAAPHMVVVQEMCARFTDEHILAAAEIALERKGAGIHIAYIAAILKDDGKTGKKKPGGGKQLPIAPPNRELLQPVAVGGSHHFKL
ncbi:YdaU family protein [Acidithiobacillus ferrivorans]|nr:YdaU family protein [Acidithiobacillus ferrivorans]